MLQNLIARAVENRLNEQSWWRRFKGTILIVLTGLVWVATSLAASPEWQDNAVVAGIGGVATAIAAIINRFTRDGVTPSMTAQLEAAAPVAGTTAPDDYQGEHRAEHGPTYGAGTTTPRAE